jgi:hypothetical protein
MQVDDQATWRRLLGATVDRATELTRKWMKENPEVPTHQYKTAGSGRRFPRKTSCGRFF